MSWKYRPFDGGYDDSLSGMITCKNTNAMFKVCRGQNRQRYINKDGDMIDLGYPFEYSDMYISATSFDDSYINWSDTHYIYVTKWYGEELIYPKIVGICCPYNRINIKDFLFKFCRLFDKSPEEIDKIMKTRYEQLCDEYMFKF